MRRPSIRFAALTLAAAALVVAGCSEKSPEEKVAELRSRYKVQLSSFRVTETPLGVEEEPMPMEPAAGEEAAPEEETAMEPEGEAAMEPVELRQDVMLDILVQNQAPERLPGLTLDISQVDAAENPKATYRFWVDTADLVKGADKQILHTLEGVDYEEGDGWAVEVRLQVPPEERGDYREFADYAAAQQG